MPIVTALGVARKNTTLGSNKVATAAEHPALVRCRRHKWIKTMHMETAHRKLEGREAAAQLDFKAAVAGV